MSIETTLVWHRYLEKKPNHLWERFLIYYDGHIELRLTTAGLRELGEIKDFYWAEITTPNETV